MANLKVGDLCSVNGGMFKGHLAVIKSILSHGDVIAAVDGVDTDIAFTADQVKWLASHEETLVPDPVNHPPHYTSHPSGVECITITEHFGFNVGNAIKYLWRAGLKSPDPIQDLKKAAWYVNREIQRLEGGGS